jgi:signal transduction histidine kinase
MADENKLSIAFLNLLINAIEAMEENTVKLLIEIKDGASVHTVTITDNGCGIPPENLSKLFEPYFTTKEKGTGLGLANTQNIIISHKASILAESEEGNGSSFTVTLNCA